VYSRRVDGKVVTFGHEGILYRNSFVMYDKETKSLWVHTTGEAVKGPLKGKRLEFVPSSMVSWKKWKTLHPDTKVLLGSKARGFMGTFAARERLEAYGLSIRSGRTARLYPYASLKRRRIVNDTVGGRPVVVTFDATDAAAGAFSRALGGRTLSFEAAGPDEEGHPRMRDKETASLWLAASGRCIEGPLAAKRLEPVVATAWLIERWKGFYPKGRVIGD